MRDWYFMTDENPEDLLQAVYFPHVASAGTAMVRQVNSGPDSERGAIADVFFAAIVAARRQILAVTPYFVPTPAIVHALKSAAHRGVDVRIIVPKRSNHMVAGLAGCALYEELLNAGVRIFERQPPFIHAKALVVDDSFTFVGTANLDARSFRLNYETNLAVFDDAFANEVKHIMLDDLAQSDELSLADWRARPVSRQMLENLSFLMMPVL